MAPWYNCSEERFEVSPFNLEDFVPRSMPLAEGGKNYVFQMLDNKDNMGYPRPQPDFNESDYTGQGTFLGDPDIWFGVVTNTSRTNNDASTRARWKYAMEPHAYRCRHQKAKYKVHTRWNGENLAERKANASEGIALFDQWGVDSLGPLDNMERYKEFVGYYTIGSALRDYIRGDLVLVIDEIPITRLAIGTSKLTVTG
jgi:hypothetical protein